MDKVRSTHLKLTMALQGVMLLGLAFSFYEKQWLNALLIVGILLLSLLPHILNRRMQIYIPPQFEMLAILFVFASVFLGEIRNYYFRYWWWDTLLHASSGFLLGIFGFLLVYALNEEEHIEIHMKPRFVALFSFVFAVATGTIWEIFEFAMDGLLGLNMQKSGLTDTMWDLIVDTSGAALISLLGYFYMWKSEGYFLERWINRFIEGNPRLFKPGKK